jgi:signal peptidase I
MAAERLWVQPEVQAATERKVRGPVSRRDRRRKERRRHRRQLAKLAVAVVAVALSAVVAVSVVSLHLGVRAVLTGSMRPDYGPGAVLLTERIPVSAVRPGMIVLFVPPGETSEFAHRVTSVTGSPDAPIITTKGDANKAPDPWHAKLVTPYANKVIGSLPGIGRVIIAIRGTGQILLAVLGGLVAAWAGSKWILASPRTAGRRTTAGTT